MNLAWLLFSFVFLASIRFCVESIRTGSDVDGTDVPPPTVEEYRKFLAVTDLEADLKEIADIGKKVARHYAEGRVSGQFMAILSHMKTAEHKFLADSSSLSKKLQSPLYRAKPLSNVTVVIAGAGPGGLRFAIEAALLGCKVHIVDKRSRFNRLNVLKLWRYSVWDLSSLGVKDLYSQLTSYTVNRIPIAVAQHTLVRIALVLGVQLHTHCGGITAIWHPTPDITQLSTDNWCDEITGLAFDAVYDGTGTGAILREQQGISTHLAGKRESIGMTFNFKLLSGGKTQAYRGFSEMMIQEDAERLGYDPKIVENPAAGTEAMMSKQYFQQIFEDKTVLLDNWVVWETKVSRYVVVTIPRQSFIDFGVVPEKLPGQHGMIDATKRVVEAFIKAMDPDKLVECAIAIAKDWYIPHAPDNGDAFIQTNGQPDISVFEYGKRKSADIALKFVNEAGAPVLLGLLGDSIETPFWPYGTGANHAFYSAAMQAQLLLAWKHYSYDAETLLGFGEELKKRMLRMPNGGNPPEYSQTAYEEEISENYLRIARRECPVYDKKMYH